MESITFQNISIEGLNFFSIDEVSIRHSVGEHAYAVVSGKMDLNAAKEFKNKMTDYTTVSITTTAQGQNPTLFCGYIQTINDTIYDNYVVLTLHLVSYSMMIDVKKEEHTYQNQSKTYGEIMESVVSGQGTFINCNTDKTTGSFIFQYQETDWEFVRRMASNIGAYLFVDCTRPKPVIYAGVPNKSKSYTDGYAKMEGSSVNNLGKRVTRVVSNQYALLGDQFTANGKSGYISSVQSNIFDGVLKSHYELISREDFKAKPLVNSAFSGRMYMGEVKEVQNNTVRVSFYEIDESFDEGSTTWFPFSTLYSSGDGSGFYCMPEVGDKVRVHFPSANENEAFVASAVNNNPLSNPADKSWKAPGGKELLLTDQGIFVICEKDTIFINLTTENGVEIKSSKPISVMSDANISLKAGGKIDVNAVNEINLQVGESAINMTKGKITLGADEVYVN